MRKALPRTGAQQYHFAAQITQALEVGRVERIEACHRPGFDLIGSHKDMGRVAHPIDFNEARPVRSYGVLGGGRVGVQLQIAWDLNGMASVRVHYRHALR